MGKCLKATPQELDAIFGITAAIPDSEVKDARKHSNFRRAIKLALKGYNDGIESFLSVLREDAKKFQETKAAKEATLKDAKKEDKKVIEKEIADLDKALQDIDKDYQVRLKAYQEEHKAKLDVNFNEEDFSYMLNSIGENGKTIFRVTGKDKDGKEVSVYDANRADAFFELLDKTV
jgi:hypothetical protein